MKPIAKQPNKRAAFTIVELLTVMSIIIILMGLLAPVMSKVRRYARRVNQKNQFHSINVALELFRAEFDGYPDSDPVDPTGTDYCGATKLAEAMVGQDLLGFHPNSRFLANGEDVSGNDLYTAATVTARIDPYLPLEQANAYRLNSLYANFGTSTFIPDRNIVLCDVYSHSRLGVLNTRKRVGMPILYFKANTSQNAHDAMQALVSIYNYGDNDNLVLLGMPWGVPGVAHPMASTGTTRYMYPGTANPIPALPGIFYEHTRNKKITTMAAPYRSDSYILLSAGFDGEYGTRDDVYNFEEELMDFVEYATP